MPQALLTKPRPGVALQRQHPLARGLLARYLLNEGNGTLLFDLVSLRNHAVLTNMDPATDWVGSPRGGALDFDGTDDFGLSAISGVNGAGSGSMVAWFKTTTAQTSRIVSAPQISASTDGLQIGLSGATTILASVNSTAPNATTATVTYEDGKWHQLVGVYDGAAIIVYFDGVRKASAAATGTIFAAAGELNIGRFGTLGSYFTGQIEDVRVYNRPLSPEEVVALYVAPYADTPGRSSRLLRDRDHARIEIEGELNGADQGWTDLTADLAMTPEPSIEYGIPGSGPMDLVASPGRMTFALLNGNNNSAGLMGYYSPQHVNLRSGFALGMGVRNRYLINGTTYFKFMGWLETIDPIIGQYRELKTLCSATDWMDQAMRERVTVATQVSKRTDEVLTTVVAAATKQPTSTSFDVADSTFAYALDNAPTEEYQLLSVLQQLALSEGGGHIFVRGTNSGTPGSAGGELRFEKRTARIVPISIATFSDSMMEMSASVDRALVINRVIVVAHPRRVDTVDTTVLFSNQGTPLVAIGATLPLTGRYNDATNRAIRGGGTDMRTPVATTDYTMNTAADGTGTDLTASFTVTATYGANSVEYSIVNGSAFAGYITKLQARGRGLYDYDPVEIPQQDAASIALYGKGQITFDMPYEGSTTVATTVGASLLSIFVNARASPTMNVIPKTDTELETAMVVEPGRAITIIETATGLSADYWVNHVSLRYLTPYVVWFEFVVARVA